MFKENGFFNPLDQSTLEVRTEFSRGGQRFSRQAAKAGRVLEPVDKSRRPDFLLTGRYRGRVLRATR